MTTLEQIYISAVRYALGRMTYIVGITVDFMLKQELSKECRRIMLLDIDEAFRTDNFGMDFDKKDWLKLKNYLQANQTK